MESKGATVESQKMCGKTPMFHGQTGFPVDVPLKQPSDLCMSYIYSIKKSSEKLSHHHFRMEFYQSLHRSCGCYIYIREKGVSFVDNSTCFIVKSCVYQHYVGRFLGGGLPSP